MNKPMEWEIEFNQTTARWEIDSTAHAWIKAFIRTQLSLADQRGYERGRDYACDYIQKQMENEEREAGECGEMNVHDFIEEARQGTSTSSPE